MGAVWRAEHLALKSPVAMKLIHTAFAGTEEALARFMREAQAAAAMRGTYVVQILDYGVDRGVPFIAMEMLSGESLRQRMDREKQLSPALIARVMTHVGRAMAKAHELSIVHRDLKPDNIFLVREDDEEVAKVLDFGIAKVTSPNGLVTGGQTRTGAILGTVYYMSPEQALGSKTVDWRTDLWAMAIITFEALTGVLPFDSEGLGELLVKIATGPIPVPSEVAPVPPSFDAWFARATNRAPEQRFQSAREQVDALRRALGETAQPGFSSIPDVQMVPPGIGGTQLVPTVATPAATTQPSANPAVAAASRTYQMSTNRSSAVVTGVAAPPQRKGLFIGISIAAILLIGFGIAAFALFSQHSPVSDSTADATLATDGTSTVAAPLASTPEPVADDTVASASASGAATASAEPPVSASPKTDSKPPPAVTTSRPPAATPPRPPAATTPPPAKTPPAKTQPPAKTPPPATTGGGLFDDRKF